MDSHGRSPRSVEVPLLGVSKKCNQRLGESKQSVDSPKSSIREGKSWASLLEKYHKAFISTDIPRKFMYLRMT